MVQLETIKFNLVEAINVIIAKQQLLCCLDVFTERIEIMQAGEQARFQ